MEDLFVFITLLLFVVFASWFFFVRKGLREGVVVAKEHEEERSWISHIPLLIGSFLRFTPVFRFDDEDWVLVIEGEGMRARVYVKREVWEGVSVGDHYVVSKNDSLQDRVLDREPTSEEIEDEIKGV